MRTSQLGCRVGLPAQCEVDLTSLSGKVPISAGFTFSDSKSRNAFGEALLSCLDEWAAKQVAAGTDNCRWKVVFRRNVFFSGTGPGPVDISDIWQKVTDGLN